MMTGRLLPPRRSGGLEVVHLERSSDMAADNSVYLRWRAGRPAPAEERFATADDALDAVVARWATLQHQAPQLMDGQRRLMLTTAELLTIVAEELAGTKDAPEA
jgi:hypothetical protein